MFQRLLSHIRTAKPIVQALLVISLGVGGAAIWPAVKSIYYDLRFLHEARANNDHQRVVNEAREQLIKQLQQNAGAGK